MKSIFTSFFCFFYFLAIAQTPVLVEDFNEGSDDSYNQFNYEGIYLGNDIIFPIVSATAGEELAILRNGELSVLKDINPGSESSNPTNFVFLNNKVYFSASDATNGGAIWETEGTPNGTKMFFNPGMPNSERPEGLIVSKSGNIYFTFNGDLYRTDGVETKNIVSDLDIAFEESSSHVSPNYCTYKNEVAFVTLNNNNVEVYEVKNDALVLLGSAAMTRSSTSVYGLSQVSNGLIFGAENSSYTDVNATYICNDVNGTIEKLQIDNTTDISRRLLPYHDTQTSLAWIGGKGYYALNGEDNSEVLLYSSSNNSFTQETTVNTAVYGNKIIFDAVEDYFTTNLVYSDGTSVGSKVLFEIKSCNSNFIIYENYAFFVTRTSNGFRPEFYFIDMEDGSYENFYNSGLSSPSNSVLLIGIQKNKLYYLSNLDSEVGRELYYIELPGLFTDLQEYILTVSNGTGGGTYVAETEVSIKADEPASGYVFDKWIGDVATIADVNASETTIIMPDSDTDISATYSPATNIHEVGNAKQESSDIKEYIYIDQANDKLYIKNNLPFNANVYSLMGEKMSIYRTADCIDLTTLQDGVYVISILIDNEYLNIKYIKN